MKLFSKLKRQPSPETPPKKTNKLFTGLSKTRAILTADLGDLFSGRKAIDADSLEEVENRLLMADIGIDTSEIIIDRLKKKISYGEIQTVENLLTHLAEILKSLLAQDPPEHNIGENRPHTILVVGVNGSGKTTTIGKLAKQYQRDNYSVMLAAGDTFRAAAIEQLTIWGNRNDVPVFAQQHGSDSAAVLFDAQKTAEAKNIDVLLADTAGRLHTNSALMEELKKIKRVISRHNISNPQEILLVLDASIGQNALQQAQQFHEAIGVTGIVLTKLDGTAKGGIIFAIQKTLGIPVRYIGIGEGVDDLRVFDPNAFVDALLSDS